MLRRFFVFSAALLLVTAAHSQNVAINNSGSAADASAMLDVSSTTRGLLIPRMTQVQRLSVAAPANGLLVYQTDGQQGLYYNAGTPGSPNWSAVTPGSWNVGGNSLVATGSFGTISNNNVDVITNNVIRGRFTSLGEFFWGATNTTAPGDLMGVVSNSLFPFAVNGFSAFNGAGVFGTINGGNTTFAAVQGEYATSGAGANTAGVRGVNQSGIAGTGFRTQASTGPRAGVIGNTTVSNGQYTFGVHGTMGSTDIRCGAVIGDDFGLALGSLGYFGSNLVDYSVYGFGVAFQTGIAGGRGPVGNNTHVGLGIYGGVMGGWVRGMVYGAHVKGERYGLYVDGNTYTNAPIAELVTVDGDKRVPAYAVTSLTSEVYAKGKATLQQGEARIEFDQNFARMAGTDVVITATPAGSSSGVYIAAQDARGFVVKENRSSGQPLTINWIAMATRRDVKAPSPELLGTGFDRKMNGVMFNDNNKEDKPQPIWWDGSDVRFDNPPPKQPASEPLPGVRMPVSQPRQ